VGRQLAVGIGAQFCKGGGAQAAQGEHFFLRVDGDLDMMWSGGGWGCVSVPADVDVAVAPRLLEVEGFQFVDLILYACDLSLDLLLLLQQLLHCCPGLLPFMTHLNIIRSAHPQFNNPTPPPATPSSPVPPTATPDPPAATITHYPGKLLGSRGRLRWLVLLNPFIVLDSLLLQL
jgi:hypothetical protein